MKSAIGLIKILKCSAYLGLVGSKEKLRGGRKKFLGLIQVHSQEIFVIRWVCREPDLIQPTWYLYYVHLYSSNKKKLKLWMMGRTSLCFWEMVIGHNIRTVRVNSLQSCLTWPSVKIVTKEFSRSFLQKCYKLIMLRIYCKSIPLLKRCFVSPTHGSWKKSSLNNC